MKTKYSKKENRYLTFILWVIGMHVFMCESTKVPAKCM